MNQIIFDVQRYILINIQPGFHSKRLEALGRLKLGKILKRKNPYLYKAKNICTAEQLVKTFLDAHLSSQEETIFGDFLEGVAIFACQITYGGWKSSAEGIDLELDKDGVRNIVSIKSGPNWGNAEQIRRMRSSFVRAAQTLRTSNSQLMVKAINGCCYGRGKKQDKGDYFKLCGQDFWEYITGIESFYVDIIEPLGVDARARNHEFETQYSMVINEFSSEFSKTFLTQDFRIDWPKLVQFNSGKE